MFGYSQASAGGRDTHSSALNSDAGFPWLLTADAQALGARENIKYWTLNSEEP